METYGIESEMSVIWGKVIGANIFEIENKWV